MNLLANVIKATQINSMQKIIEQNLGGNEEVAKTIVKYTWEKDEIAWYFCNSFRDVFKVQFTGERWFLLSRWGDDRKIYQYRFLESSGEHELKLKGLDNNGISHGEEESFYTTKEEALSRGYRFINRIKDNAIKDFENDMERLNTYEKLNK